MYLYFCAGPDAADYTQHDFEFNTFLTCSVAVPFSFTRSFPNMQTPTLRNCYLFILGRFHRCCLSGRTLSMKKMRILMSCGNLKGAQAAPLSPKSPYAAHHLQSLSSGTPSLLMPSAFPGYWAGATLAVPCPAWLAHSLHARLHPTRPPPTESPHSRAFCSTAD